MNTSIRHLAIAIVLATAGTAWAQDSFLKATVTGTVQTQLTFGLNDGRIHTGVLNNKRIFEEFAVSPKDYELVMKFGQGAGLTLVPRHTGAMLPEIPVTPVTSGKVIINTKSHVYRFQSSTSLVGAPHLFKDFDGQLDTTAYYKGPFPATVFSKVNMTVIATGTDNANGGNASALLKFKVTTQGPFVQQP